MANAEKRIAASKDKTFQDRCFWYMHQKAAAVFAQETPDADDLLLAKALWAGQVKTEDMARIVLTNATVGAAVDAGTDVTESDIEYVIVSDTAFNDLAVSYRAAGLIGT
jgi:hypothetical protein